MSLTPREFAQSVAHLPQKERVAAQRKYRLTLPTADERENAELYFLRFPYGEDDSPPVVIVFLHGIRTWGEWQDRLTQALQAEYQVTAHPIKYGRVDILRFLVPFLRRSAVKEVTEKISCLERLYPGARIAICAHSFGSYLVGRILMRNPALNVTRLLLCGSILPRAYGWQNAFPNGNGKNIVNDVGTRDIWPIVAYSLVYGCGESGRFGFGHPYVVDRFHDLGHCDFFSTEHVTKYWVPFLIEGQVVTSPHTEERKPPGFFAGLCLAVPLKIWVPIAMVAALLYSRFPIA
ncbi:hypothetical protein [Bordetella petrii]|uniref:hypothetical protein n=1 Tax=Bordetella petrii TaxID=94624 RepID=UPI0038B39FA4